MDEHIYPENVTTSCTFEFIFLRHVTGIKWVCHLDYMQQQVSKKLTESMKDYKSCAVVKNRERNKAQLWIIWHQVWVRESQRSRVWMNIKPVMKISLWAGQEKLQ